MGPSFHCVWMLAVVIAAPTLAQPAAAPARTTAPSLLRAPTATDADLEAAWVALREAVGGDPKAREAARTRLSTLRVELAIEDLEPYSVGLVRASEARAQANDSAGSVELARAAAELSPDLPAAQFGLMRAFLAADASEVGRAAKAMGAGLLAIATDPQRARALAADLGVAFLFALAATLIAVTAVLFLDHVKSFVHDFRHLLPRATARWLGAALACLVLAVPLLLRLGLFASILALLAAVALYLSKAERVVAGVLLVGLGALPLAARTLVEYTSFAGTPAEDVYRLERGGVGLGPSVARVKGRIEAGAAGYAELFALGRYELRRGRLDEAVTHLTDAVGRRNNDARATLNLGNALAAKGNLEGAVAAYEAAAQADPKLAAAQFNLSRLYARRAESRPEQAALEVDRAHQAFSLARGLDPRLAGRETPAADETTVNRALITVGLLPEHLAPLARSEERAEKVKAQVERALFGGGVGGLGPLYAVLGAAFLGVAGGLARLLRASHGCAKCGGAACARCDPGLPSASDLCQACVNVYEHAGKVAPPLRVRKQIEVARRNDRRGKVAYALAVLCSGAGHLFNGLPVRGALLAFSFLFLGGLLFFGEGVLRPLPHDLPPGLRLVPLGLAFLAVYLLSLRALYRRQS